MEITLNEQDLQRLADLLAPRIIEALKPLLRNYNNSHDGAIIFDINGLAEYLNVSIKWIYEQTHLNTIPFHKLGNQLRFRKNEIDKWFDTLKTPASKYPSGKLNLIKK